MTLYHIFPKRANAKITAIEQHVIRSVIMALIRRYCSYLMYNLKRLLGRFATNTLFADMKS